MNLPNAARAVVPPEKLTAYLLSETHPDGAPKAELFRLFGFGLGNWQDLVQALLNHAAEHDIVKEQATPFGVRYVPVWFIDMGTDVPRLVTAYPLKGDADG
jgi:hypothetical protein